MSFQQISFSDSTLAFLNAKDAKKAKEREEFFLSTETVNKP
ncbi:hypothetical protein SCG7109_AC_00140 [Chlamydiales bacterium SCGC AG-110-M15]|nr:hypothetical protein SCG7109_AC_00140 [Chlamydiales bacterium SCGC AG-110-M15]